MSRTHASFDNPMILEAVAPQRAAAIRHTIAHNAFHCRLRASNFNTRVFPVCP